MKLSLVVPTLLALLAPQIVMAQVESVGSQLIPDKTDSEKRMTKDESEAKVDRTDPAATARACLEKFQKKDLAGLAQLGTWDNVEFFQDLALKGPEHKDYQSLFSGWRWDAVEAWDPKGKLDVRYRDSETAAVGFGQKGRETFVVVLVWKDNEWRFDDINSPRTRDFQRLPDEKP